VDASVADWIASETRDMEKAWSPADSRAAVAFVHIPPHAIQVLQSTLDPEKNPGMNGDFPYFRSGSGLKLNMPKIYSGFTWRWVRPGFQCEKHG
jgi:hypothetical protein